MSVSEGNRQEESMNEDERAEKVIVCSMKTGYSVDYLNSLSDAALKMMYERCTNM